MTSIEVDAKVGRLARQQHGVFTLEQARRAGATSSVVSRRVLAGEWERLHPRTFALKGVDLRLEGRALAAVWSLGGDAAASHLTAAALLLVVGARPLAVDVTVGRGRHQPRTCKLHESTCWPAIHRTTVGIIPVTTVERTLVDLGLTTPQGWFEPVLDDALASGKANVRRLDRVSLEVMGRGVGGSRALIHLLAERLDGPVPAASELERALLRRLDAGGWGRVSRQAAVPGDPIPGLVDARLDHLGLIVEADGRRWHTRVADFSRDRRRDRRAGAAGFHVARFTYDELVGPGTEVEDVLDAHATRAGYVRSASGLWVPAA
jgi:very-short-patch-repair endonuclease